jgi:hypothetical protein
VYSLKFDWKDEVVVPSKASSLICTPTSGVLVAVTGGARGAWQVPNGAGHGHGWSQRISRKVGIPTKHLHRSAQILTGWVFRVDRLGLSWCEIHTCYIVMKYVTYSIVTCYTIVLVNKKVEEGLAQCYSYRLACHNRCHICTLPLLTARHGQYWSIGTIDIG